MSKQELKYVTFKDGAHGYCSCSDPEHHIEGNDLQPSDPKATEESSKAQLIRNLVDLYDEYNASATRPTNPSLRGFISYLRGQL